jgi:hypothetical protein
MCGPYHDTDVGLRAKRLSATMARTGLRTLGVASPAVSRRCSRRDTEECRLPAGRSFDVSFAQMRAAAVARPLPRLPFAVLSKGQRFVLPVGKPRRTGLQRYSPTRAMSSSPTAATTFKSNDRRWWSTQSSRSSTRCATDRLQHQRRGLRTRSQRPPGGRASCVEREEPLEGPGLFQRAGDRGRTGHRMPQAFPRPLSLSSTTHFGEDPKIECDFVPRSAEALLVNYFAQGQQWVDAQESVLQHVLQHSVQWAWACVHHA